jgi:hypothetical protein
MRLTHGFFIVVGEEDEVSIADVARSVAKALDFQGEIKFDTEKVRSISIEIIPNNQLNPIKTRLMDSLRRQRITQNFVNTCQISSSRLSTRLWTSQQSGSLRIMMFPELLESDELIIKLDCRTSAQLIRNTPRGFCRRYIDI